MGKSPKPKFVILIEQRLTELGVSKLDFYRLSGISSATFSNWSLNKTKPTKRKLESVCDLIGVNRRELLSAAGFQVDDAQSDDECQEKDPPANWWVNEENGELMDVEFLRGMIHALKGNEPQTDPMHCDLAGISPAGRVVISALAAWIREVESKQ